MVPEDAREPAALSSVWDLSAGDLHPVGKGEEGFSCAEDLFSQGCSSILPRIFCGLVSPCPKLPSEL